MEQNIEKLFEDLSNAPADEDCTIATLKDNFNEGFIRSLTKYMAKEGYSKRPQGKWIKEYFKSIIPIEYDEAVKLIQHEYFIYKCSICGREKRNKEPYCSCGASMNLEN
jgi:hypothetical protein